MTGFGRGTNSSKTWLANVEAASINRKQLEIVANLPRSLQSLETRVRKFTTPLVSRGRIQITIRLESADGETNQNVSLNRKFAKSFDSAFADLSDLLGRPLLPSASDFLRQPGIFEIGESDEIDPETAWECVFPALGQAVANLNEMRAIEGKHLEEDFLGKLTNLEAFTATISDQAPFRPEHQRALLHKRLADMKIEIDQNDERLSKEVAIFADRCDISEEITRLHSHFSKFREYISSSEPAGRPLDFLCQELFREFNTIGSKANDATIAQTVVEAKTELEKLREQVQNVE